jgi:hypothetical protein
VLQIGKEEIKKTKWAQGKGIFDRAILFYTQDTIEGVSGFRIDRRTMKRG